MHVVHARSEQHVLIIVEGTDRAGKSTLVWAMRERIEELYPGDRVELFHAGPPTNHPLDEYERPLLTYRPGRPHHIICDRWHVGESVYPTVLGRPTQLTPAVNAHIEASLRARGALLVHVSARPDVLINRLYEEMITSPGKSSTTPTQLFDAHVRFATAVQSSTLHSYALSTTSTTGSHSMVDVRLTVAAAQRAERDALELVDHRTYVGGPAPSLLLVGDVRHTYRHVRADIDVQRRALLDPSPAFMPYQSTSGAYLLDSIMPLLGRYDVGLMNANDVDDAHEAWQTLGKPTTVALGRDAFATTSDWVTGAVPHPQFVRRFFHQHQTWYCERIERAATGQNLLSSRPDDTQEEDK